MLPLQREQFSYHFPISAVQTSTDSTLSQSLFYYIMDKDSINTHNPIRMQVTGHWLVITIVTMIVFYNKSASDDIRTLLLWYHKCTFNSHHQSRIRKIVFLWFPKLLFPKLLNRKIPTGREYLSLVNFRQILIIEYIFSSIYHYQFPKKDWGTASQLLSESELLYLKYML